MDFVPPDFSQVPYGSVAAASCAPRVADPRFKGIAIRTPERIRVSQGEPIVLPVCGYYQLDTAPLLMGAEIHVHAKGVGATPVPPLSGKVVTDMGENAPEVPPPGPPVNPRDYAGQVSESYFYYDAQRYLPLQLPPGTYDIMITYGRVQSNTVRVEISKR